MPLIGPSLFMLGLVVASVTTDDTSTVTGFSTASKGFNNQILGSDDNFSTTGTPFNTITVITRTNSISRTTSTMNISDTNSAITPSTTNKKDDGSSKDEKASPSPTPTMSLITPKVTGPSDTKTKGISKDKDTIKKSSTDSTGIIILVVIILVALGFGIACYCVRQRGRRYSVDLTSRLDEANIPLSSVEPGLPIDNVPQNGLQTFESAESSTTEPQEPGAKLEVQEEQKAEADKSVVDPSAESAAPAPFPDSSEDKPKEDVAEPSPPAPVDASVEEKTDDEGVVSNKTSVESLKETNENNSNNADLSQKRDLKSSNIFWDVPLNCPV